MRSCTKRRSDVSHYVIIIRLICVENTEKLKNTASAPFMDFIWFLLLFLALAPNVRAGGQRTDDHIDKQEQKHRRCGKMIKNYSYRFIRIPFASKETMAKQ